MTGEVTYAAANAKCSANLKVKGKPMFFRLKQTFYCATNAGGLLELSFPSELPLNFLTPLSDVQVYEKDEARFEVELSRPPKSFRWLKGSQELQSDNKYDVTQEGNMYVLLIRSSAYDDEAKYMFEAEDKRTASKLIIQGNASYPFIPFFHLITESLDIHWLSFQIPLKSTSVYINMI